MRRAKDKSQRARIGEPSQMREAIACSGVYCRCISAVAGYISRLRLHFEPYLTRYPDTDIAEVRRRGARRRTVSSQL